MPDDLPPLPPLVFVMTPTPHWQFKDHPQPDPLPIDTRDDRTRRFEAEREAEEDRLECERVKAERLREIYRRVHMFDVTFERPDPPLHASGEVPVRHEPAALPPDHVSPMRGEVGIRYPDDLAAERLIDVEPTNLAPLPPDRGLSELEIRFCHEYAANPNGAAAARVAGYSRLGAKVSAVRLLRRPAVRCYINHLRKLMPVATPSPSAPPC